MYWIHALTPLHVGAGRGIGFIDLPIMREKATGWPIVPGSSVKGVWRDYAQSRGVDRKLIDIAFGSETDSDDHAGSLAVTDARIVLLPVRSFYGTFAYVTSPLALMRLRRDLEAVGAAGVPAIPEIGGDNAAVVTEGSALKDGQGRVYLEDIDLRATAGGANQPANAVRAVDAWAEYLAGALFPGAEAADERAAFRRRFIVVADGQFDYFCEQGTEVNARVRINDDKKTVANGALWYEESLPTESVLAGIVWWDRVFGGGDIGPAELLDRFCGAPLACQLGGKASVGKGSVRMVFTGGAAEHA